jgi:hypothetical protein
MARNEAKETIFLPCIFLRKALLPLSLMRCNPAFSDFALQLFLRRIGGAFFYQNPYQIFISGKKMGPTSQMETVTRDFCRSCLLKIVCRSG